MKNIKIGSFNTKDNIINRNGGIREDGLSNAQIIVEQINKEKFDFLGTQELTIKYVNEIVSRISNYKLYGKYRYGNLLVNMPYNENNNIITNKNVIFDNTIWLPWIPNNLKDLQESITKMSIMPRIATIIVTENEDKTKTCMINTHLDYQIPSLQIRQLKTLKDIIEKYKKTSSIILTGDFNMEVGNPIFDEFIDNMKNIGIKRAEINENTWYNKDGRGKTLDHIFIPDNWNIEDAGIIDMTEISDHNAIYVKAKIK